jgi:hypothetical protein
VTNTLHHFGALGPLGGEDFDVTGRRGEAADAAPAT